MNQPKIRRNANIIRKQQEPRLHNTIKLDQTKENIITHTINLQIKPKKESLHPH